MASIIKQIYYEQSLDLTKKKEHKNQEKFLQDHVEQPHQATESVNEILVNEVPETSNEALFRSSIDTVRGTNGEGFVSQENSPIRELNSFESQRYYEKTLVLEYENNNFESCSGRGELNGIKDPNYLSISQSFDGHSEDSNATFELNSFRIPVLSNEPLALEQHELPNGSYQLSELSSEDTSPTYELDATVDRVCSNEMNIFQPRDVHSDGSRPTLELKFIDSSVFSNLPNKLHIHNASEERRPIRELDSSVGADCINQLQSSKSKGSNPTLELRSFDPSRASDEPLDEFTMDSSNINHLNCIRNSKCISLSQSQNGHPGYSQPNREVDPAIDTESFDEPYLLQSQVQLSKDNNPISDLNSLDHPGFLNELLPLELQDKLSGGRCEMRLLSFMRNPSGSEDSRPILKLDSVVDRDCFNQSHVSKSQSCLSKSSNPILNSFGLLVSLKDPFALQLQDEVSNGCNQASEMDRIKNPYDSSFSQKQPPTNELDSGVDLDCINGSNVLQLQNGQSEGRNLTCELNPFELPGSATDPLALQPQDEFSNGSSQMIDLNCMKDSSGLEDAFPIASINKPNVLQQQDGHLVGSCLTREQNSFASFSNQSLPLELQDQFSGGRSEIRQLNCVRDPNGLSLLHTQNGNPEDSRLTCNLDSAVESYSIDEPYVLRSQEESSKDKTIPALNLLDLPGSSIELLALKIQDELSKGLNKASEVERIKNPYDLSFSQKQSPTNELDSVIDLDNIHETNDFHPQNGRSEGSNLTCELYSFEFHGSANKPLRPQDEVPDDRDSVVKSDFINQPCIFRVHGDHLEGSRQMRDADFYYGSSILQQLDEQPNGSNTPRMLNSSEISDAPKKPVALEPKDKSSKGRILQRILNTIDVPDYKNSSVLQSLDEQSEGTCSTYALNSGISCGPSNEPFISQPQKSFYDSLIDRVSGSYYEFVEAESTVGHSEISNLRELMADEILRTANDPFFGLPADEAQETCTELFASETQARIPEINNESVEEPFLESSADERTLSEQSGTNSKLIDFLTDNSNQPFLALSSDKDAENHGGPLTSQPNTEDSRGTSELMGNTSVEASSHEDKNTNSNSFSEPAERQDVSEETEIQEIKSEPPSSDSSSDLDVLSLTTTDIEDFGNDDYESRIKKPQFRRLYQHPPTSNLFDMSEANSTRTMQGRNQLSSTSNSSLRNNGRKILNIQCVVRNTSNPDAYRCRTRIIYADNDYENITKRNERKKYKKRRQRLPLVSCAPRLSFTPPQSIQSNNEISLLPEGFVEGFSTSNETYSSVIYNLYPLKGEISLPSSYGSGNEAFNTYSTSIVTPVVSTSRNNQENRILSRKALDYIDHTLFSQSRHLDAPITPPPSPMVTLRKNVAPLLSYVQSLTDYKSFDKPNFTIVQKSYSDNRFYREFRFVSPIDLYKILRTFHDNVVYDFYRDMIVEWELSSKYFIVFASVFMERCNFARVLKMLDDCISVYAYPPNIVVIFSAFVLHGGEPRTTCAMLLEYIWPRLVKLQENRYLIMDIVVKIILDVDPLLFSNELKSIIDFTDYSFSFELLEQIGLLILLTKSDILLAIFMRSINKMNASVAREHLENNKIFKQVCQFAIRRKHQLCG